MVKDPDCVVNLAQNLAYTQTITALNKQMTKELKKQKDPIVLGNSDIFEHYPNCNVESQKRMYGNKYIDMQIQAGY